MNKAIKELAGNASKDTKEPPIHTRGHPQSDSMNASMLGIGLYTVGDAAAYTDIPAAKISRWLFGYKSSNREHKKNIEGLWRPQLDTLAENKVLGFKDLLEVRFVHAFRQHGVSLQAIRAASAFARDLFHQDHPFTCKRFQTDGRRIFATVYDQINDEALLDMVKRQYVFKQVVKPSLYASIEYGKEGDALRWYPLQNSRSVVLDPQRSFGRPILVESGVNTAAIAQAYKAEEKDVKRVAKLYEISLAEVEAAVRFELKEAA